MLPGTDYVVNCIEVSGVDCVGYDNDIPARYGVDQCIGDTVGPGGVFKGLRTIPVWLEVLADVERLAPRAIVLNYTNPMSMMCLAAARTSTVPVVGLVSLGAGDEPHPRGAGRHPVARAHLGVRGHQPPRVVHAPRARRRATSTRS